MALMSTGTSSALCCWLYMQTQHLTGSQKFRRLAVKLRASADDTNQQHYKLQMQDAADELDNHAAKLEAIENSATVLTSTAVILTV
jgi:hypothetical protein